MNFISDIQHIFYINLDSRPDRKEYVETQLSSIGIKNATRFKAIELKNGALGCSFSHLRCLEHAKQQNWDHVMIVEDDICFTKPDIFVRQMNKFLSAHKNFDVLLIAGNNIAPYTIIDRTCVKINKCQTTTGYLVKNNYYDTLITNYREGIQKLTKNPEQPIFFAIDKYWFQLQEIHNWYLITPLTVTQREDYSNIEKRNTNYTRLMLELDKEYIFKKPSHLPKLQLF